MLLRLKPQVVEEDIVRRNISHRQFAEEAGISAGYLSLLLAGKCSPGARTRCKLLKATRLHGVSSVSEPTRFDQLFEIVEDSETRCGAGC